MSRVLITGANGFIGKELCKTLRRAGHSLIGTSRDISIRAGPNDVPFYHTSDIDAETDWSLPLNGADTVVHLAAKVHDIQGQYSGSTNPFLTVNSHGTRRLAEEAAVAGIKRLVFISSVKVNGESTKERPFLESDQPVPVGAYAISKWQAEQSLWEVSKKTPIEIVILRVPLVYGPNVKANFFSLLKACGRRNIFPLKGIKNQRSLLYVENLTSAINVCIDHPNAAGKIFFVSDGQDYSTPDLIKTLADMMESKIKLFYLPLGVLRGLGLVAGKRGAIDKLTESLQIDSSSIKEQLQWSQPFSVEEGLQRTVSWYLEKEVR